MVEESELSLDIKEVQSFMEITSKGEFYEFLEQYMTQNTDVKFKDRQELKKGMLSMLYSENGYHIGKTGQAKYIFSTAFPTISRLLSKIKSHEKACLPVLLQRIESYLMITNIATRVNQELPEAPIFTIHDSIATTSQYVDQVSAIINEELTKNIGAAPTLKKETWTPSEAWQKLEKLKAKIQQDEELY